MSPAPLIADSWRGFEEDRKFQRLCHPLLNAAQAEQLVRRVASLAPAIA